MTKVSGFIDSIAEIVRKPVAPRAIPDAAAGLIGLFSVDDVDHLLTVDGIRPPFIALVNAHTGLAAWNYTPILNTSSGTGNPASVLGEVIRHRTTIILQHLHRRHPTAHAMAAALQRAVDPMTVQCNAYFTPARAQGVKPHADQHHTLLVQTSGRKHWRAWGNIDRNPATPMVEYESGVAASLAERTEPDLVVTLEPGDCLLIPRGHVHCASTGNEHSLHLTFGLSDPTVAAAVSQRLRAAKAGYLHALPTHGDRPMGQALSDYFPLFVEVV